MTEYNTSKSAPANRSVTGPFDVSEQQLEDRYADFGSIKVLPTEGMDIRLEIEENTQRVVAVAIHLNNSSLQLQAFAASKTEGLWHEVRSQLADSVKVQNGISEERLGPFGPELVAQLPPADDAPGSPRRHTRFVGVDGPRWFLRGLIGGAAITDPAAASQIDSIFRSVVVDRGAEPMPPRELLPLRLPEGVVTPPQFGLTGLTQ